MFQVKTSSWHGPETDVLGECLTTYHADHHGIEKIKKDCQRLDDNDKDGVRLTSDIDDLVCG